MRKPYRWNRRTRTAKCRLCGKPFVTTSARQRYCHGEACDALLAERTAERKRRLRQLRLAAKAVGKFTSTFTSKSTSEFTSPRKPRKEAQEMLKVTGTVHEIMPTEVVGSKGFAKRTLVICDDPNAQYPSYVAFEAKRSQKKDRTLLLDQFRKGETVEVAFVPDARPWRDPKTGRTRWFASLVLIDVSRVGGADGASAAPVPAPAEPEQGGLGLDVDDMPF